MISPAKYQSFTDTTVTYPRDSELQYLTMELCNEAGEVAGKVKKRLRGDSHYEDDTEFHAALVKELGDVMYPLSQMCNYLGITFEELMEENMEKLSARKEAGTIQGDGDDR